MSLLSRIILHVLSIAIVTIIGFLALFFVLNIFMDRDIAFVIANLIYMLSLSTGFIRFDSHWLDDVYLVEDDSDEL